MDRSGGTAEYLVYVAVVDALLTASWTIVCASPPSGTDPRFPRCHLRRGGGDRGLRDEVDITAVRDGLCLLVECKGTLSDSLTVRNALGETDVEKLARLVAGSTTREMAAVLERIHGRCPAIDGVRGAVAVRSVNAAIPCGLDVLVLQDLAPYVALAAGTLPASLFDPPATDNS